MKGVREAALTKDEPEIAKEPKHHHFDSDRYDGSYYDQEYGYGGYRKQGSLFAGNRKTQYEETMHGQLKITVSISNSQIGDVADEYSEGYSYEKTIAKAENLAKDEMTKLAGAEWQKRYFYSMEDCNASWGGVEVEIKLTPLT